MGCSMKYALMIDLGGNDDWIYVTEDTDHCWDLKPVLYENFSAADQAAQVWRIQGKDSKVKVVEYLEG